MNECYILLVVIWGGAVLLRVSLCFDLSAGGKVYLSLLIKMI